MISEDKHSTMRSRICWSGYSIDHNSVRAFVRGNACLPFFMVQIYFCVCITCFDLSRVVSVVSEVMRSQGNLAFTYGGAGGRPNTLWINCWRGCSKAGIKVHSHIMSIFLGSGFAFVFRKNNMKRCITIFFLCIDHFHKFCTVWVRLLKNKISPYSSALFGDFKPLGEKSINGYDCLFVIDGPHQSKTTTKTLTNYSWRPHCTASWQTLFNILGKDWNCWVTAKS